MESSHFVHHNSQSTSIRPSHRHHHRHGIQSGVLGIKYLFHSRKTLPELRMIDWFSSWWLRAARRNKLRLDGWWERQPNRPSVGVVLWTKKSDFSDFNTYELMQCATRKSTPASQQRSQEESIGRTGCFNCFVVDVFADFAADCDDDDDDWNDCMNAKRFVNDCLRAILWIKCGSLERDVFGGAWRTRSVEKWGRMYGPTAWLIFTRSCTKRYLCNYYNTCLV